MSFPPASQAQSLSQSLTVPAVVIHKDDWKIEEHSAFNKGARKGGGETTKESLSIIAKLVYNTNICTKQQYVL